MSCRTAVLSAATLPRLEALLAKGWERRQAERDILFREFRFKGFKSAWAFMNRCADEAIRLKHHPEWLNVYNRVEVTLTTHAVGNKLTDLDIDLAEAFEKALEEPPPAAA